MYGLEPACLRRILKDVDCDESQPGTPHPCKDMSDHGDAGKEKEAFHENSVKLLRFSIRQSRKTSVIVHITILNTYSSGNDARCR